MWETPVVILQRKYLKCTSEYINQTQTDMKKSVVILVMVGIIAFVASGMIQRRELFMLMSVPETEILDNETMEFVYQYSWCADTVGKIEDNMFDDKMLLQIGHCGLSKFSSYTNLSIDSLIMNSNSENIIKAVQEGKLSNGEFMTIYKNYPDGKLTHTEKICQDWLRYDEDLPSLEWVLTDSVTVILGYECQSAKCKFRGREWLVFYAEDIPIAEGPWKLYGLPGLIMKAYDDKAHYTFECIGIKSKADRPITIYKVPFNNVTRSDYYDTRHRYEVNPYAYFEATTGAHINVNDESGNPMPDAFDPIELPYEYLELDWKK